MKGHFARDFHTDSLGKRWVLVIFMKRSKIGRLLKLRKKKKIRVPKGFRVIRMENHKPKIGSVTITYEAIRGRKPKK